MISVFIREDMLISRLGQGYTFGLWNVGALDCSGQIIEVDLL